MRYGQVVCVLALLSGLGATAQTLPKLNGSCSVSASGLESCDWMSAITLRRKTDTAKNGRTTAHDRPEMLVTRYILAPGAPLQTPVEGRDAYIVGINMGEIVNEKSSPPRHVDISNGLVMFLSKDAPYLLRNVG